MAIKSMAEFFGVDASDVFDKKEQAEGYLGGQQLANKIHALIQDEHGQRSRTFREGVLEGLRETL